MSRDHTVLPAPYNLPASVHGTERVGIEVTRGVVVPPHHLAGATDATMAQATRSLRIELKDALSGMVGWFPRDALLAVCADVIDEDTDPGLEQTPTADEADGQARVGSSGRQS